MERDGADLVLRLSVRPGARHDAFVDIHGNRLRVQLAAPPVDGKANRQLVRWLAAEFGVKTGAVTIETGMHSRLKRVRICEPASLPGSISRLAHGD
jgi:uncharacterized protein (TIGR00251 family)